MPRARSYKEDLLVALRNPEEAREYLNAALEDGNQEVFLLALQDVIDANMGMKTLANISFFLRYAIARTRFLKRLFLSRI